MNIEDLYLIILDKLNAIPDILWADQNIGQLDVEGRPAVPFPCALISIDMPQIDDLGNGIQKCRTQIGIRLGFDYKGSTAAKSPGAVKARALDYYRIIREVYKAVNGYNQPGLSRLKRNSQMEAARHDQIKILDMGFYCEILDKSAIT
tara:strand:+ start:258 stop:701 length:444 start_codon:yes stop_codon:yes gene_type:complete